MYNSVTFSVCSLSFSTDLCDCKQIQYLSKVSDVFNFFETWFFDFYCNLIYFLVNTVLFLRLVLVFSQTFKYSCDIKIINRMCKRRLLSLDRIKLKSRIGCQHIWTQNLFYRKIFSLLYFSQFALLKSTHTNKHRRIKLLKMVYRVKFCDNESV